MTKSYEWKLPDNWEEILKQSNDFDVAWTEWKSLGMPRDYDPMPENPTIKDSYKGWACIHGPAETHPEENHTGKSIEELIVEISDLGGDIRIGVDQWWGIWSKGSIENWADEGDPNWIELEFDTFIQADRLHDGLEMTYDVWKSRWEFHKQKEWKW